MIEATTLVAAVEFYMSLKCVLFAPYLRPIGVLNPG